MRMLVVAIALGSTLGLAACGGKSKDASEPAAAEAEGDSCCCTTGDGRELLAETACTEGGGTCEPADTCETEGVSGDDEPTPEADPTDY